MRSNGHIGKDCMGDIRTYRYMGIGLMDILSKLCFYLALEYRAILFNLANEQFRAVE